MSYDWPTKVQDMYIAREVIAEYGGDEGLLGIFEIATKPDGKVSDVRLAEWVMVLIKHFRSVYGVDIGDTVMKKVVSSCLVNGEQIH